MKITSALIIGISLFVAGEAYAAKPAKTSHAAAREKCLKKNPDLEGRALDACIKRLKAKGKKKKF